MVIRGNQFAVWLCVLLQVKKCVSCLSTCIFPDKTTYPIDETMVSFVIVGSCVELLDTILNWWGLKISRLCLCISMAKEYKNYELWFLFHYFLFFLHVYVLKWAQTLCPCLSVVCSLVCQTHYAYMLWCNATHTLCDGLMLLLCILTYGNLYCYRFIMDHLTSLTLVMHMQKDLSIFKTSWLHW